MNSEQICDVKEQWRGERARDRDTRYEFEYELVYECIRSVRPTTGSVLYHRCGWWWGKYRPSCVPDHVPDHVPEHGARSTTSRGKAWVAWAGSHRRGSGSYSLVNFDRGELRTHATTQCPSLAPSLCPPLSHPEPGPQRSADHHAPALSRTFPRAVHPRPHGQHHDVVPRRPPSIQRAGQAFTVVQERASGHNLRRRIRRRHCERRG